MRIGVKYGGEAGMQWEGKGSKRNNVGLKWEGRVKGREGKKIGMGREGLREGIIV